MNDSEKLPAYFLPHGGGPWHVMDDAFGDPEGYGKLKKYLEDLGKNYKDRINAVSCNIRTLGRACPDNIFI